MRQTSGSSFEQVLSLLWKVLTSPKALLQPRKPNFVVYSAGDTL